MLTHEIGKTGLLVCRTVLMQNPLAGGAIEYLDRVIVGRFGLLGVRSFLDGANRHLYLQPVSAVAGTLLRGGAHAFFTRLVLRHNALPLLLRFRS